MAESFIDKFNRNLGYRAGIPIRPIRMPNTRITDAQYDEAAANRASVSPKFYLPQKLPSGSFAGRHFPKPSTAGKLTDEQKRRIAQLTQLQARETMEKAIEDKFGGQSAGDRLGAGFGRFVDLISRPIHATSEAALQVNKSVNEGEPAWSLGDDIGMGLIRGLWGTKKTTPGEAIEEAANRKADNVHPSLIPFMGPRIDGVNSFRTPVGPPSTPTDQQLPDGVRGAIGGQAQYDPNDLISQGKRGVGLLGEVYMDPFTWGVSGSLRNVMRATGELATERTVAEAARTAAETLAKKHLKPVTGPVKNVAGGIDPLTGKKLGNTFVGTTVPNAAHASEIGQDAADVAAKLVLEVRGGAQAGKLNTGGRTFVPTLTNAVMESYRRLRLSRFEKNLGAFAAHIDKTKRLSVAQILKLQNDPEFMSFYADLLRRLNEAAPTKNFKTWQDVEKALSGRTALTLDDNIIRNAADMARSTIGDEVKAFGDDFAKEIDRLTYRAPGVRMPVGKGVTFSRVGRVFSDAYDKLPISGETLRKFSYENLMPGRLAILSQKAKSLGIKPYEKLHKAVSRYAKEFTKDERKIISRALDNGTQLTDPRLEAARQFIRRHYDEIFEEESKMGINTRKPSDQLDNYQFVFNRRGTVQARAKFKAEREALARSTGSFQGYTVADAAAQGLRPVEDAFEALLYRKMDSNRALTRAWFKADLLDNYGLMSKGLSQKEKIARKLEHTPRSSLSEGILNQLKDGEEWYLPGEIHGVMKAFEDLSKMGSRDGAILGRIFDNLTNKFKFMSTVLYPGFHVRNMIGDVFMGFLDGVRSGTYSELLRKILLARAGKHTSFKIGEGLELTYDELNQLYMKHAAAGRFHSSDLNPSMLGSAPRRATDILRNTSEYREDFGRMAHFLHALREEYPAARRAGKIGALDKATEAAVFRVNKYKFDYSALTAYEHNIKRFIAPFYTYARKSIPTLMEALWLSPANMGRAGRLFTDHQGQEFSNFNHLLVPEYRREVGYALLKDEEEPWALGAEILPPGGALQRFDTSDLGSFSRSLIASANPFVAAIPEQAMGRYAFNEQPLPDDFKDYLLSKVGPYTSYKQLKDSDKSMLEQLLANRVFLGASTSKITNAQQNFAFQELQDQAVDDPFDEFNKKYQNSGIHVKPSIRKDGTSFRVYDEETDQVVFESDSPVEALKFAEMAAKGLVDSRGELEPEIPEFRRSQLQVLQDN